MNRPAWHPRTAYLPRTLIGRLARSNDSGASLIIALIIITVVALVTSSVLFFANTGVRTTVELRDQASVQYQANNAVQSAIESLRTQPASNLDLGCGSAASPTTVYTGSYASVGTSPMGSVAVTCKTDPNNTGAGFITTPNGGPGTSLLAVHSSISVDLQQYKHQLQIDGGIFANTTLSVDLPNQNGTFTDVWPLPSDNVTDPNATSWVIARQGTDCGAITLNNPTRFNVICGTAANPYTAEDLRGTDPGILVPDCATTYTAFPTYLYPNSCTSWPLPSATGTVGTCIGTGINSVLAVAPGKYTVDQLAALPACTIVNFKPGIYYIVPGATNTWSPRSGTCFVGGTLNANPSCDIAYQNTSKAKYPTCKAPDFTAATQNTGVEFVVAPSASISVNTSNAAYLMLCASSVPATVGGANFGGPPIALYGLQDSGGSWGGTAVLDAGTSNCPYCFFSAQGVIYAPSRQVNFFMNNGASTTAAFGIIAAGMSLGVNSSVDAQIANLAGGIPQQGGSVVPNNFQVLQAYVCPNSDSTNPPPTCSATDAAGNQKKSNLTAKVAIVGYLNRSVSVISWAPSS